MQNRVSKNTKLAFELMAALLILLSCSSTGSAHNKVVVIPLAGDDVKPLANIITVSTENGDFNSPIAAMESINDASIENPYLIVIGPGIYTYTLGSPLIIKSFVSMTGSGLKSTTLEAGFGSEVRSDSAVVAFAPSSRLNALSALTINQYGNGSQISSGIHTTFGTSSIHNIDINVTSTGLTNYGMFIDGGSPKIKNVNIKVENGQNSNIGVYLNNGSQAKIDGLDSNVRGGVLSVGVYLKSANSLLRSINGRAMEARGSSWGIYSSTGSVAGVRNSQFFGRTKGCHVSPDSDIHFLYSTILDGCSGGGTARCILSTHGSLGEIPYTCILGS